MEKDLSEPRGMIAFLKKESTIVVILLLFNLMLVAPNLTPILSEINRHDEAKYIYSGSELLKSEPRDLAWGPLVALIYAPLHLIFGDMDNWLVLEAWAGRFILYSGLWLSTYYLANQFRKIIHPFLISGVLFTAVVFFPVVENQSDALFASLSAFTLAKLISFNRSQEIRDIWIGSACLGLGILSRVESVVLIAPFLLASLYAGYRRIRTVRIIRAALIPMLLIYAVFVLISSLNAGVFDSGFSSVKGKAWTAFIDNSEEIPWDQLIERQGETQQTGAEIQDVFGTHDENEGSVLRAALRNPLNFVTWIAENSKTIPDYFLEFYNKKSGPVLLLFSAWGIYALIRRKEFRVLLILGLWGSQALVSLAFLSRHLVPQISYLPLVLGAMGISHYIEDHDSRISRFPVVLTFLLYTIASIWANLPAFYTSGIILSVVFLLYELLSARMTDANMRYVVGYLLIFAVGVQFHSRYNFPNFPEIGGSPIERSVTFLREELPTTGTIATSNPLPILAAKRNYLELGVLNRIESKAEFDDWLAANNIIALYVEPALFSRDRVDPQKFETFIGDSYEVVFEADPGSIEIYLPVE